MKETNTTCKGKTLAITRKAKFSSFMAVCGGGVYFNAATLLMAVETDISVKWLQSRPFHLSAYQISFIFLCKFLKTAAAGSV
jgi:hypothetical protein